MKGISHLIFAVLAAFAVGSSAAPLHRRAPITAATDTLDGVCTTLQIYDGSRSLGYASRNGNGWVFTTDLTKATSFRLEATQLNRYEIYDGDAHLYVSVISWIMPGDAYGERTDWTFSLNGTRYAIRSTLTGQYMGSFLGTLGGGGSSFTVALATATNCYVVPDVPTNVTGTPTAGVSSAGEIVGVIDMHNHLAAGVAFGGKMRCGTSWDEGGVVEALPDDCEGFKSLGIGAILEGILGGTSITSSSEKGWPDFSDWPTYNSQLHEQAYFRNIERAYKSGVRIINVLLVENRVICEIYPIKNLECDEMTSLRRQAQFVYAMQDYIDAQSGGKGKGWFRIAKTPAEVRSIAAQNKLAVLLGLEDSEVFGCRFQNGSSRCTRADIDAGLAEMQALGVSGLFPVHKFDNALGGTRMDPGLVGAFINIGNLASTGNFWQVESCTTSAQDQPQPVTNDDFVKLFNSGVVPRPAGSVLPIYPTGPQCNIRGLTDLGTYLIQQMMKRGMIIHVDHMSIKTANMTLNLLEAAGYPGVISEHSWSDYFIVNRVLGVGGVVAAYGFNSTNFVKAWRDYRGLRNGAKVTSFGFGSDVNGLGSLAPPRTDAATNPFRYPFTTLFGTTATKQTVGTKTYDFNTDGVAHYGLYAEWLVDNVNAAGSDAATFKAQLLRSAEAYTQMWEKSVAWAKANP